MVVVRHSVPGLAVVVIVVEGIIPVMAGQIGRIGPLFDTHFAEYAND